MLDQHTIKTILNLQGSPLISESVASRQLEVIRKGFNFISEPGNDVLYIADEVGLGKTYIALGIASLLRHFSTHPQTYQDVIVVPKENLQYKWEKEIRQFIKYNFLLFDNRVKSAIGSPVGEIESKEYLEPLGYDHPGYHLYRNTQFSFGITSKNEGRREQLKKLTERLTEPFTKGILEEAFHKGYFLTDNKPVLKKLYAYLLSLCNPAIELLIVDEGHNFKHGLGSGDDDDVSDRNNVAARFFGLKRKTEDDEIIFDDFPQLAARVRPKVQKLLVLSATPKTNSLLEFKGQFECFLKYHILSGLKTEKDVEERLHHFLIRGNMEYMVGEQRYTRNLCRLEHRSGGVDQKTMSTGLSIRDNEQAIILGLMQHSTIKYLGAKHNATFELGMLAGFETFRLDQEKWQANVGELEQEYEEVRTRKTRNSQDYSVLKNIVESYKESFDGALPPHPKQNAVVDSIFQMMLSGQKSLVFVRRVASAYELERRLLDMWSQAVADELQKNWKKLLPSKDLNQMLDSYREQKQNRKLVECIDGILSGVIQKLINNKNSYPLEIFSSKQAISEILHTGLMYLYNHYRDIEHGDQYYRLLCWHCHKSIIKTELVQLSYQLLVNSKDSWMQFVDNEKDAEESNEVYFFHNYFRQPHVKAFRKKVPSADWFDLNFYLLNQHFRIASFDPGILQSAIQTTLAGTFREIQEAFIKSVLEEEHVGNSIEEEEYTSTLSKNTLITEILITECHGEFADFINRLRSKRKSDVFAEVKVLGTIIRASLRNGSGLLPLFIADKAEGDFNSNYIKLLTQDDSLFNLVLREIKTIIRDYEVIRAVNFPEGESFRQMETKLYFQTPALGLTGQSTRNKSNVATQFRMPGFPYALITTDIFREGEDLHTYCQHIFHYGIAWNCSDMEQRTGRIDRINSLSHRKLQDRQVLEPDNQIHVYYPYLKNTLEVNQVSRLFKSVNSFIETFNDFTKPVLENSIAYTGEAISDMPEVIKTPLYSKFDHQSFIGNGTAGEALHLNPPIGMQKEDLLNRLQEIVVALVNKYPFYFGPALDTEDFTIKADMELTTRSGRRGPFRVIVRNDIFPGKFVLEVGAYLFKVSSKVQKELSGNGLLGTGRFDLDTIEDLYALTFKVPVEALDMEKFTGRLVELLGVADTIEMEITNDDFVVFT